MAKASRAGPVPSVFDFVLDRRRHAQECKTRVRFPRSELRVVFVSWRRYREREGERGKKDSRKGKTSEERGEKRRAKRERVAGKGKYSQLCK